jgi:hypothetical protein
LHPLESAAFARRTPKADIEPFDTIRYKFIGAAERMLRLIVARAGCGNLRDP